MTKVAIVDKCETRVNYGKYFDFEFEVLHLVDKQVKKILKKDITLDFSVLDEYDYIITVGAEPTKFIAKTGSVTSYQGHLVGGKYIPLSNPSMLVFKPEALPSFTKAVEDASRIIAGETLVIGSDDLDIKGFDFDKEAELYTVLEELHGSEHAVISLDTETTALYPRDGYVIGVSMSWKNNQGIYFSTDCISEKVELLLQKIFDTKKVVFHNAKFDIKMLSYHFGFTFPNWEDTMLMHYVLDETTGTHGLKHLAMKYTELGDYDKELDQFKREYCTRKKIKLGDFTYDLIPFDIMYKYAAIDTAATFELYKLFKTYVAKDDKIEGVYNYILKPGTTFLIQVEDNGVPFDVGRLKEAQTVLAKQIHELEQEVYNDPYVLQFKKFTDNTLNIGSPTQLRILLFNIMGLTPISKTATGADSTDAETLKELSEYNPLVGKLLEVRQLKKIRSTYIDKILLGLDKDGRLRTGFNLTTTTSGRLSSSGKLNLQQLPRDNKVVKKCIKAREGYTLVSMDLQTAEMYVVAVLSGDTQLQNVFKMGGDFHGAIAKQVFNLPCEVSEVKSQFADLRQAAKAVSFGILYGSGPAKVAEAAGISLEKAKEVIVSYFTKFSKLKSWLSINQDMIRQKGHTYSVFGRKRRLKNVTSSDNSVVSHDVRSGINFLVQSTASDINLLAAVEMQEYINKVDWDVKIIMLVHDSIVAEVKTELLDEYLVKLTKYVQKDRGISIKGTPIGLDIEIGDDYSFPEVV